MEEAKEMGSEIHESIEHLTTHGLVNIYRANGLKKMFWIFTFAALLFTVFMTTHNMTVKYLKYPVNINVANIKEKGMKLPSLTFCPTRFSRDKNLTQFFHFSKDWNFCRYMGDSMCDIADFTMEQDCITLQNKRNMSQYFPGRLLGYRIMMYADKPLAIDIHDADESSAIKLRSFLLEKGNDVFIEVTKTLFRRLPHPYPSNCSYGEGTDNLLEGRYTYLGCAESCLRKHQFACGIKIAKQFEEKLDLSFIRKHRNKTADNDCLRKAVMKGRVACNCPTACESHEYKMQVSNVPWDVKSELESIQKHFQTKHNMTMTRTDIRKNFYFLNVYYNVIGYQDLYETKAFTGWDLLSSMGGTLGICIGSSVVSTVEIVALAFVLVKYLFKRI